ncbi:MAG: hypothetical protein EPN21_18055 [Methylococcaceae bacterium]|nr:MAG: hypothetical protein EPN21_18055 [Methylococcaceae bacterium]
MVEFGLTGTGDVAKDMPENSVLVAPGGVGYAVRTVDGVERYAQRTLRSGDAAPVVGLLPGSRRGEIKRLLPAMLQAAALLAERMPAVQFILPQADTVKDAMLAPYLAAAAVPVRVVPGRTYDVLQCCDAVVTCSGTATLETALMGVPMVIVYKLAEPSYWLGRMLVQVPHIGLPNIIAGRGIVPELIQHAANPPAIADAVQRLLTDAGYSATMRRDLAEVKARLGEGGGSAVMAELALELL